MKYSGELLALLSQIDCKKTHSLSNFNIVALNEKYTNLPEMLNLLLLHVLIVSSVGLSYVINKNKYSSYNADLKRTRFIMLLGFSGSEICIGRKRQNTNLYASTSNF